MFRDGRGVEVAVSRHDPQRTCVGCRRRRPQSEMIRIVVSADRRFGVNPGTALQGRSAYLCPDQRCLDEAVKRRALSHTLRVPVPDGIVDEVRTRMKAMHAPGVDRAAT